MTMRSVAAHWVDLWWSGRAGSVGSLLHGLLLPAEWLYRGMVAGRNWLYARGVARTATAEVPVISVGNLAVGGAGKTPFARWLVDELETRGCRPALIHGGYAGDEPALHREWHPAIPVVVDRDRVRAARVAVAAGADVIVLDDAFQHRRIARRLDIVLVAAESWERRRHLLPRGPWREGPRALRRAHLLVITRRFAPVATARAVAAELAQWQPQQALVHLRADRWRLQGASVRMPEHPVVAVAAIARPIDFLEQLRALGCDVVDALWFADHHAYTAADAVRIRERAAGRALVSTAKDWVKLRELLSGPVYVLEQEVVVEVGGASIEACLERVLRCSTA